MNFKSLFLGLFLASGIAAYPQGNVARAPTSPLQTPANASGPRISFANAVHDFGKVRSGEVVKFNYAFTNTGNETLEITAVQPSCGCTAAGDWTRRVEPGQTGIIPIQFNALNYNGPVLKTVSVVSNDKTVPTTVLQLKGTIWRPVDVLPQFAVLNIPPDQPEASTTVRILNNMDEPLTVYPPVITNRAFNAELRTNTPGKEFHLVVTSVPPLSPGNVQGTITLKTSSTNFPIVTVNVWANIQPQILVMPPQVTLPAGPLPNAISPTITMQNNSTNPLSITGPETALPGVDVDLRETLPGRQFQATLKFPQGFELPGGTLTSLVFKSNNPKLPQIKVPVAQMPRQVLRPAPQVPQVQPAGRTVPALRQ